jgi:hypothetical protein
MSFVTEFQYDGWIGDKWILLDQLNRVLIMFAENMGPKHGSLNYKFKFGF